MFKYGNKQHNSKGKRIPAFWRQKYPQRLHPWSLASLCSISGTFKTNKRATFTFPEPQILEEFQDTIPAFYVAGIYIQISEFLKQRS